MGKYTSLVDKFSEIKSYKTSIGFIAIGIFVAWFVGKYYTDLSSIPNLLGNVLGVLISVLGVVVQDSISSQNKRIELEEKILQNIEETQRIITKEHNEFEFYGCFICSCEFWPRRRYVLMEIKKELGRIKVIGDLANKGPDDCLGLLEQPFESKAVYGTETELWYVYDVKSKQNVTGGAYCKFSGKSERGVLSARCNASFIDRTTRNKVEAIGIQVSQNDFVLIKQGHGAKIIRRLDDLVVRVPLREGYQPYTFCLSDAEEAFTGAADLIKEATSSIWAARFSGGRRPPNLSEHYVEWTRKKIRGDGCKSVEYKRLITIDTKYKFEDAKAWLQDHGDIKLFELRRSNWRSYIDFLIVDGNRVAITFQDGGTGSVIESVIITSEPRIVTSCKMIFTAIWDAKETEQIKGHGALEKDKKEEIIGKWNQEMRNLPS